MGSDAQEVPPGCEDELCCAGGRALEVIVGVSLAGGIPEQSGLNPVPCPQGCMALLEQGGWTI